MLGTFWMHGLSLILEKFCPFFNLSNTSIIPLTLSLFSFWYSNHVYITYFMIFPQSLNGLFCFCHCLSVYILAWEISIDLSSRSDHWFFCILFSDFSIASPMRFVIYSRFRYVYHFILFQLTDIMPPFKDAN